MFLKAIMRVKRKGFPDRFPKGGVPESYPTGWGFEVFRASGVVVEHKCSDTNARFLLPLVAKRGPA